MDDKVYNQIFLKPRFQIDFEMNANELLEKIKAHLHTTFDYKIKMVDNHIIIDISENKAHFWSPQLQIEIQEISENTSKVKGLFGPKPQVWTLFMFIHFFVGTAFFIFGVIAYSNWSLGENSLLPVVMLIVLPIVWVLLYFIGTIGKSTGKKQMDELKSVTKKLLKEIKN